MNNPADLHEGTAVRLGGRDYIVPALTLRMVRRFENDLGRAFEVGPLSPAKDRRLALEIIHAAMSRNYPKLTVDELEDLLDLGSTPKVFLAVMGLSGLLKKDGDSAGGNEGGRVDWDELIAHIVVSTGWTWREAGDLTFPQYKALARQWRKTPPAHLLLAGYVGYAPPAEFTPEDRLAGQEDSLNELAALDGVVFQN